MYQQGQMGGANIQQAIQGLRGQVVGGAGLPQRLQAAVAAGRMDPAQAAGRFQSFQAGQLPGQQPGGTPPIAELPGLGGPGAPQVKPYTDQAGGGVTNSSPSLPELGMHANGGPQVDQGLAGPQPQIDPILGQGSDALASSKVGSQGGMPEKPYSQPMQGTPTLSNPFTPPPSGIAVRPDTAGGGLNPGATPPIMAPPSQGGGIAPEGRMSPGATGSIGGVMSPPAPGKSPDGRPSSGTFGGPRAMGAKGRIQAAQGVLRGAMRRPAQKPAGLSGM